MKLVVIGGHSRSVGKTSLAVGIIAASPELGWTALKITQYGHGICSANGHDCDCVVDEPDCPFAITPEIDPDSGTDTSRFLQAGAEQVYWVRTRVGQLELAMPQLKRLLADREFVIIESNSILGFLNPDVYLPVLRFDTEDFKLSNQLYFNRASAYAVVGNGDDGAGWPGVDLSQLERKPVFAVQPPSYFSVEVLDFLKKRLVENGPEMTGARQPNLPDSGYPVE